MRSRLVMSLACVLLFTTASSCIRYYKTAKVRARLAKGLRKFDAGVAKAGRDLGLKRRVTQERALTSIPRVKRLLETMQARFGQLRALRATYVALQRDFEKIARGRSRIRSDHPQWAPLQQLKERATRLGEKVKGVGKAYSNASNQLAKRLGHRR
ncbi:MAG: hypothetical protein JRH20_19785 [Deltaproteobacteria bacterium]|nr:hypothetical protein [Deltaproteobacteria bacterium]